eukprot:5919152-Amphidinium_carterae.1
MQGRGKVHSHTESGTRPDMPKLSVDFLHLGQQGDKRPVTVLVMYDSLTMRTVAAVLPGKKAHDRYVLNWLRQQ